MSAPVDAPIKMEYRPRFNSLPYCMPDTADNRVSAAHQSFSSLPGYRNISFEEQRLHDTSPLPAMATGKVGKLTPSALESIKAACNKNHKNSKSLDVDLLEPLLPIIKIRVAWKPHAPTVFAIHRNILEYCSPFFKALLISMPGSGDFKIEPGEERSAEQETIELEGSALAFRLYTEWVYSGLIPKRALMITESETETGDICFQNIGQAYILGQKLQDQNFKNAIIDLLLETIVAQGKMDLTLPTLIFDKCSATAPLRKLLVDVWAQGLVEAGGIH